MGVLLERCWACQQTNRNYCSVSGSSFLSTFSHFLFVCSQYCDSKVSSTNLIHTLTTVPLNTMSMKGSIIFSIGLTQAVGTHLVELSEEQFTQDLWSQQPLFTGSSISSILPLTLETCVYY